MNKVKYPRTFHHPSSLGVGSDDKVIKSLAAFEGQEVVITEKMDGENSTLTSEYYHARSLDSRHHPSRDWIKTFHGQLAHNIPPNLRVCGENLFAQHSIKYTGLVSYFYAFSIWDIATNVCQDWDLTTEWFELLGLQSVPVLYRGPYDPSIFTDLANGLDTTTQEGIVMRLTRAIPYDRFNTEVCKWVRKGHVQTDEHWMFNEIKPNLLKAG